MFPAIIGIVKSGGFEVSCWFTGYWWAYYDELLIEIHQAGKTQTQSIMRKQLDLRNMIKRLARQTICFPEAILMHDTVIKLLFNYLFFELYVHSSNTIEISDKKIISVL